MYRRLVFEPTFLFFIKRYRFELFLNTINKNNISKITSNINKSCKLIFEKNKIFALIKAKNVSMQRQIESMESKITVLKP